MLFGGDSEECVNDSDTDTVSGGCCDGSDHEVIIAGTAGIDGGTLKCMNIGCRDRTADLDDCAD